MRYIDFTLLDESTAQDILGKLLTSVHAINLETPESQRISVAFPGWEAPEFYYGRMTEEGTTGNVLRMFGTAAQLEQILERKDVQLALHCTLLQHSAIEGVPLHAKWVRFVRERAKDRRTNPSALRRRQRRAEARGETVGLEPLPRMETERPFHAIPYESGSNGQVFEFRIAKDTRDGAPTDWATSFSTFGMATSTGGVPCF